MGYMNNLPRPDHLHTIKEQAQEIVQLKSEIVQLQNQAKNTPPTSAPPNPPTPDPTKPSEIPRKASKNEDNKKSEPIKKLEKIQKPHDFEPDIFVACIKGKLTSVQYLFQENPEIINKKDAVKNTPPTLLQKMGTSPLLSSLWREEQT